MSLFTPFKIGETPINKPALLEASAGTGKTYTLIRIVRDLIAKENKKLNEILIVTFTKKAVQELKERVRDILENPIDQSDLDKGKEPYSKEELLRLKEAALSADEAPIFTMHGFCKGVLQSFPFECGSEFKLDISETEDLLPEVILDYIRKIEGSALKNDHELNKTNKENDDQGLILKCWETTLKKTGSFQQAMESIEKNISQLMNTPSANILPNKINPTKYQELLDQFVPTGKNPKKIETDKQAHTEKVELALFEAALWKEIPGRLSKRKEEEGVITFNDMIDRLYQLLRDDGENKNSDNQASGELLIDALRKQYSVLLIDEFQDTDTRQWTIFRRIFSHNKGVFFLIGDPKQSIYGFRGTELQVYHDAAKTIPDDRHYLLPTNFRSAPQLTEGINTLFQPLFSKHFSGQKIDFIPVETGSAARLLQQTDSKTKNRIDSQPIEFLPYIKTDEKGEEAVKTSVDEVREYYDKTIVAQIIKLLSEGYTIFDEELKTYRSLCPEDIAILAETNKRLSAVEMLLTGYGIPSNNAKTKDIVETAEAADMIYLLNVLANPSDQAGLKSVLILPLFGLTLSAFLFLEDNSLLDRISDRFYTWHKDIISGSFIEVMEDILKAGNLLGEILKEGGYSDSKEIEAVSLPYRERILGYRNGERIYTNTSHLIEILYQAIRFKGVVLEDLANYLTNGLKIKTDDNSEGQESGIRLDKEAKGINLITIHSSKGLEFPVVFFHAGYGGYTAKSPQTFLPQNSNNNGDKSRTILLLDNPERKDEAMYYFWEEKKRLYYVAMTRPSSKIYLPLPSTPINTPTLMQAFYNEAFPEFSKDLIAQGILKEDKAFPMLGGFKQKVEKEFEKKVKLAQYSPALYQHIESCIKNNPTQFALSDSIPLQNSGFIYTPATNTQEAIKLTPPRFKTKPVDFSRRTIPVLSYSTLTSTGMYNYNDEHQPDHQQDQITSEKERDSESKSTASNQNNQDQSLVNEKIKILGAGPEFGTMVHNIFERIDLYLPSNLTTCDKWAENEETKLVIEEEATRFYQPEKIKYARPLLISMVYSTLTTPLSHLDNKPLCDPAITPYIKELEFLIKIKKGSLLEKRTIPSVSQKEGFLKGFIDLIFRYNGKVYIADWKTNLVDGYDHDHLQEMMAQHRYDLQFKIYQTALIRYLSQQDPSFTYDDFGGVFYFFVRGMNQETSGEGVFFKKIAEEEFIEFSEGLIGLGAN